MYFRVLLIALACCLSSNTLATDETGYTLYLVRHAEKQNDGTRDPALTGAGEKRAEHLARWLLDKGIQNVWSSDYKRTRSTASPLAKQLKLELQIYDPRKLDVLAGQLKSTANNSLVVGHSNTTPELARQLCECTIADMDESEYDRLIEISVGGGGVDVEVLKQGLVFSSQDK